VVPLLPLLDRTIAELQALAGIRGSAIVIRPIDATLGLACDDRAAERLFARLLATLVSATQAHETLAVSATPDNAQRVLVTVTRPRAIAGLPETALFNLDAEREAELPGAPLLGTGFALRLVANLAVELGGQLTIGADRLTLALPAASLGDMGQASTN
jgi:hypothetical protein